MLERLKVQFVVDVPEEDREYLRAAARIRGVTPTELIRRALRVVLRDQLFLSILDDGAEPRYSAVVHRKGSAA